MERDQFRPSARRHRWHGLVFRLAGHGPSSGIDAAARSFAWPAANSIAESNGEILLRCGRALGGAGRTRRHHGALRGGRHGFYGIPLAKWLPYSVARTWHLQIGIFWIATSWLATGLYIVPAVSGVEPKGQRLGVNLLFGAVVAVVVGSLAGEWLGIQQKLGNLWFWLGSQGYEYVDLGRLWQILLFVGLTFWLWLMWRGLSRRWNGATRITPC